MSQLAIAAAGLPVAAFLCSVFLTAGVKRWAVRTEFVSRPREDRYNRNVIALGGGIAIFWTIALFVLAGAAAVEFILAPGHLAFIDQSVAQHTAGFQSKTSDLLVIVAAAFILHLTGLWDDRKHPGPFIKLAIQFAVAIGAAIWADVRVEMFIENTSITTALSVFWIVLMINAFNFLDNMDGASAGIALIATGVLMAAAFRSGQVFVGAMGLVFIGALAGFLVFNFPPAKIFMGDGGSMVVGFFVALLTLRTTYYNAEAGTKLYSVFMPAIAMAVPLYDFISVTFLRLKQGKSPFVGDTQHFSHRLKRRGLSDRQVALTLYLATLCTGLGAILLQRADLLGAIMIAAQTVLVLVFVAIMEAAGAGSRGTQ
ncbi:MAG: undecaprenyl/decaprenyl-phosphate alpha-N-acetylglucosaminyl 1-phosphate transferase [Planctomycetales bacterium]|nr:undecaprenyl/decaprenyl-phosphate alpha-N-acetylglucosaminyl 1-phosphate transferase [Planctomycetales bacterium]